jgi:hypothetical protein
MVCLCKDVVGALLALLPPTEVEAPDAAVPQPPPPALATDMLALAQWLSRFGLPAPPWQPDPAWLRQPLPQPPFPAAAMGTLAGFAQLRDSALALGVDPLLPAQGMAFTRLAATVTARLTALLDEPAVDQGLDTQAAAWSGAATTLAAVQQVQTALRLGAFPATPLGAIAAPSPALPLAPWRGFLRQLRPLLPLIALAGQLGLTLSASLPEQLAGGVRMMRAIPMPDLPVAAMGLMARLTGLLSAVAQLRRSLGVDPLQLGLPAVTAMVAEQVARVAGTMRQELGCTPAQLLAGLPQQMEYCPTLMAPPAVVHAAYALEMPAVTWQVPPPAELPVLRDGLPLAGLCVQLQAALGTPMAARPCGARCDAAALATAVPQRTIAQR